MIRAYSKKTKRRIIMFSVIFILLMLILAIGLFFLASPTAFFCSVLLLLFFEFKKIKAIYTILFTGSLILLGLLGKFIYCIFIENYPIPFFSLLCSLFTCSLTLALFILIKFTIFIYKGNE